MCLHYEVTTHSLLVFTRLDEDGKVLTPEELLYRVSKRLINVLKQSIKLFYGHEKFLPASNSKYVSVKQCLPSEALPYL